MCHEETYATWYRDIHCTEWPYLMKSHMFWWSLDTSRFKTTVKPFDTVCCLNCLVVNIPCCHRSQPLTFPILHKLLKFRPVNRLDDTSLPPQQGQLVSEEQIGISLSMYALQHPYWRTVGTNQRISHFLSKLGSSESCTQGLSNVGIHS